MPPRDRELLGGTCTGETQALNRCYEKGERGTPSHKLRLVHSGTLDSGEVGNYMSWSIIQETLPEIGPSHSNTFRQVAPFASIVVIMPVAIALDESHLRVCLTLQQRVLCGRFSDITIPFSEIDAVKVGSNVSATWYSTRYGIAIPHGLKADLARTIQITLNDKGPYKTVVLEVEEGKDPNNVVAAISNAIGH
ncbi:hypothetical protein BC832DRAFT_543096 [Gaertneriomyces semiglobifer]|nr:hypothetical protein BC832DRAFT_543096 [Gaertneriomyces semiglobifer]